MPASSLPCLTSRPSRLRDPRNARCVNGRGRRVSVFCAISFLALPAAIPGEDPTSVFHAEKLAEIDSIISLAISDGHCPGGVVWIERNGVAYHKAFGNRAVEPQREAMTEETIF